MYFLQTLSQCPSDLNTGFTLGSCLFGSVKLTKNADLDKYKHSKYSIGFDSRSEFSFADGSLGKNVILGADVLILGKGPTQGLDDTTLTAVAKYSINFMQPRKRFVLSLHYNESNSFLFVNGTKNISSKLKTLK